MKDRLLGYSQQCVLQPRDSLPCPCPRTHSNFFEHLPYASRRYANSEVHLPLWAALWDLCCLLLPSPPPFTFSTSSPVPFVSAVQNPSCLPDRCLTCMCGLWVCAPSILAFRLPSSSFRPPILENPPRASLVLAGPPAPQH